MNCRKVFPLMDKRLQRDERICRNQALAAPAYHSGDCSNFCLQTAPIESSISAISAKPNKDSCLTQKDVTASRFQIVLRLQRPQD